jgi:hypothetical protein
MNPQITDYINASPKDQQEIMNHVRSLIHQSVSGVTEEFKWSRPVFKLEKDFAYLQANKKHVNLGFMNFHKINDTNGILEGTGKDMRHIKLVSVSDINSELLRDWFIAVTKA